MAQLSPRRMKRRTIVTAVTVLLGVVLGVMWSRRQPAASLPPAPPSTTSVAPQVTPPPAPEPAPSTVSPAVSTETLPAPPPAPVEARITLADELNSPNGTIQQDLHIIR